MSNFNRKGYTTVRANNGRGGVQFVSVHKDSKLARIAAHKNKQINRARKEQIRKYKEELRAAKKRVPLERRSHIGIADL